MDLKTFVIRRLIPLPLVLLGVTLLVFVISFVVPGDPVALALGPNATPSDRERFRTQLGLDRPLPLQYLSYLGGVLQGDLGTSLVTQRSVIYDLRKALPASLELSFFAIMIAVLVGIPLGVWAAVNANRWPDYLSRLVTLSGVSMERAWTAVLLQLFIASYAVWLPLVGRISGPPPPEVTGFFLIDSLLAGDLAKFVDSLRHLLMPALALSLSTLAQIARITRSRMLEETSKEYIQAAVAQGLPPLLITYKYMLRNALTATLTVIGLAYGFLLGNAFLVEAVFGWPGLGSYGVVAILNNDLPAVAGVTLVMGATFVIVNTLVDLLYAYIDPRIRYAR
jgi:peptide/nickel transport system permease protein